jgi:Flp pilus assembly pilin Flp
MRKKSQKEVGMSKPSFLHRVVEKVELGFLRMKMWRPRFDWDRATDEEGQTTIEYDMIIGLIAAIIMTIFLVIMWPVVGEAVKDLVEKIRQAISGEGIE